MSPNASMIFLWSTPRSVSTALERVMKNSPELDIAHEPFTDVYYFSKERRSNRYGNAKSLRGNSISSTRVKELLLLRSRRKKLFIKELAFQGEPFVDNGLLQESQHILLIRKPQRVYQSLIKLKPDFSEDEFGFCSLDRVYKRLLSLGKNVEVIDGDDFTASPESVVRNLCHLINVEYKPSMLCWESGQIRKWNSHESESQAKWHKTLERSKTIVKTQPCNKVVEVAEQHQECFHLALDIYYKLTQCRQLVG